MRVAIITENFLPKVDGVTRTLAMLLEHLQRRGDRALVLGPAGSPRRYAGARVVGVPGVPVPFYPELRVLFPWPVFGRRLAQFRPDIVHVVDPVVLGAVGIRWAQRLRLPVVSSYHTNLAAYCGYFGLGALEDPIWAYRRALHNRCAETLCPSPSTAGELARRGFERVATWSRGVDASLFTPARRSMRWRERVAGDPARTILLYVGRLSHEKNLQVLVAAYDELSASGEDMHLVLVGDGPARGDLERALAGRRVTFTGYLRGEELAQAYASADVFAFPSRTETFGQVVQEAMASGLPVVAFDADGVRDLLRGGTGLLVPPDRGAEGFASALRCLVADPERRGALGQSARSAAEGQTWDRAMDSLIAAYERVVAQPERTLKVGRVHMISTSQPAEEPLANRLRPGA